MSTGDDNDSGVAEHLSAMSLCNSDDEPEPTKQRTKKDILHGTFHPGPFTKQTDFRAHCKKKAVYRRSLSFPIDYDALETLCNIKPQHQCRKKANIEKGESQKIKLKDIAERLETNPNNEKLLKRFYITANQLIIYRGKSTVCLLCVCGKKSDYTMGKKSDFPASHIFPLALLRAYREIHCGRNVANFIWETSDSKTIGVTELSYDLFCQTCEKKACSEESFLKGAYLQIMSYSADESRCLSIDMEMSLKLRHVLALLMFRGVLMGVNLVEEMGKGSEHFDNFLKLFLELRNYCLDKWDKSLQNFHLFLLPNFHFNPLNIELAYILDFQLHNPQFTSVLTSSQGTPYLYMKFDCFHCVLPFDDDATFSGSCFNHVSGKFKLPKRTEAIDLFPEELLQHNISQTERLLNQFVYDEIPPNIHCIITLHKCQTHAQAPKKQSYPHQLESSETEEVCIGRSYFSEEELFKKAHDHSPLRKHVMEYKRLLETTQDEIANLQEKNKRLQEENEALREENEKLRKSNTTETENILEDRAEVVPVQPSDSQ